MKKSTLANPVGTANRFVIVKVGKICLLTWFETVDAICSAHINVSSYL